MDGLVGKVQGGPAAKDGGMRLTVYIRHEGKAVEALRVRGHAEPDGTLTLQVTPLSPGDAPGMRPFTIGTKR